MTRPLLTIRKAVPEDTTAIVGIWKEFMDFHAQRDRHFTRSADGHQRFADFISGRIVHEASCVAVAEQTGAVAEQTGAVADQTGAVADQTGAVADQTGAVVGYCLAVMSHYPPVFLDDTYGAISDLAVSAHHRRQGIGAALVTYACAWFIERGITRIELRVATSNEVSTAFWRKMGFRPYVEILYKTLLSDGAP